VFPFRTETEISKAQILHNKCCKHTTNRASSVPSMMAPIKGSFLLDDDDTGIATETHRKEQPTSKFTENYVSICAS
jgi:hypothetical protein